MGHFVRRAASLSIIATAVLAPLAHAQFTYQQQERSISVQASALAPVYTLTYPDVCQYPSCGPSGSTYVLQGDTHTDRATSARDDFGSLTQQVATSAKQGDISAQAQAQSSSELRADGITLNVTARTVHTAPDSLATSSAPQNTSTPPNWAYRQGNPYAKFGMENRITFTVSEATQVELLTKGSENAVIALTSSNGFYLSSLDSNVNRIPGFSATRMLAPGSYVLEARVFGGVTSYDGITASKDWAAGVILRAVPEPASWLTMALGLVGVAFAGARRRG